MENIITGFIYLPILSLTHVFIYQALTIYYAPWFVWYVHFIRLL